MESTLNFKYLYQVLEVLNQMIQDGIIKDYTIGGGISVLYYVEPTLTYDLDVIFTFQAEKKGIVTLQAIYDYLKEKGYQPDAEHIIIKGIRVQFLPSYGLQAEALLNSKKIIVNNSHK